jgi:sugar lactone lactonase YvrE
MQVEIEQVAGPFNGAAGGVAWDGERVLFSAVGESRILGYEPASGDISEVRRFTNRVNGLAMGLQGEFYGAQEGSRRIIEFVSDGSSRPTQSRIDGDFHNFPTDLVVDSLGRIWFADPYNALRATGPQIFPPLKHASVLRASREKAYGIFLPWTLKRVTFDTAAPRAVLLSRDERTLYVAEGDAGGGSRCELRAYAIDENGNAGEFRLLHKFAGKRYADRGISGMTLDDAGNIVACAGWRASGPGPLIYVFAPSGAVIETLEFPEDIPMRCAFGGSNCKELFVTTGTGKLFRIKNFRAGPYVNKKPSPLDSGAGNDEKRIRVNVDIE